MSVFLIRKIGFLALTLAATSLIIFIIIRAAGGDPATVILNDGATPEQVARLRTELGLDRSVEAQYFSWIGGFFTGDLGNSYLSGASVAGLIAGRIPITVPLILAAMSLAIVISVLVGVTSAYYSDRWFGTLLAAVSQVGIAVPAVWLGIVLALIFGVSLGWLPTGGWVPWSTDPWQAVRSLILPVVSLALILAAQLTRFVRSAVLETMSEDFVRTARAGGMRKRTALLKIGLRNAALPITTILGLQFVELIGGTIIIETVYSLPGLSRLILSGIAQREFVIVQSVVMVVVIVVVVINLAVDVCYGLLDPRVRRS